MCLCRSWKWKCVILPWRVARGDFGCCMFRVFVPARAHVALPLDGETNDRNEPLCGAGDITLPSTLMAPKHIFCVLAVV
jgi:hypothetical protein